MKSLAAITAQLHKSSRVHGLSRPPVPTQWCPITGAPGSGKTTLVTQLATRGFLVQGDTARAMLQKQIDEGSAKSKVRRDEASHRREVLLTMLRQAQSLPTSELIFLDYALPDNIAFAALAGLRIDSTLWTAARTYRYKHVFIAAPLPLSSQDPVRKEDQPAQLALDTLIRETYSILGYQVIDLPAMPIQRRVEVVLDAILNS